MEEEIERCWKASIFIHADTKKEAKKSLKRNLSGVWYEVDDFEFTHVPWLDRKKKSLRIGKSIHPRYYINYSD